MLMMFALILKQLVTHRSRQFMRFFVKALVYAVVEDVAPMTMVKL